MRAKILVSMLTLIMGGTVALFGQEGKKPFEKKKTDTIQIHQKKDSVYYYTCPVHMEVRMSSPGKCPVCGMALEKRARPSSGKENETECLEIYACPRHPELHESKPGKCTKCGENMVEHKKEY